jgi:GR25 family glycosyltransferase involved in LPS biosynthesis
MCFLGALMVVCFKAQELNRNSRYLHRLHGYYIPETGNSSAVSISEDFGLSENDEPVVVNPPTHPSLPPIYWINLDVSASRRRGMEKMFRSLGINNTVRVSAFDIKSTLQLRRSRRLIFHPNVTLEARDGRPSNKKHVKNIYEYQEVACLMSHIKAIQHAYKDGHPQVLIVEDDALFTKNMSAQWGPYVDQAPLDWKILQFATNNPNVVRQGVNLVDPFVTWQPYHWSTRAYLINRAGMQTLMDKFHSISSTGLDIWRIDEVPMVVADEVIYFMTGDAYTSTGLWVDSQSFRSTIQSKNAHSTLSSMIGDPASHGGLHRNHNMLSKRKDSVLVLMSIVVKSVASLTKELQWIRQDNHVLASIHQNCVWEINIALRDSALMESFERETATTMPSNIHFHPHVSTKAFNKFTYIRTFVDEMANYDLILFKDNDQRIAGFPWRSFVERKGDAVVSGPLRQNADEALLWRRTFKRRQYFQFHSAERWTEDWNTEWSANLFAEVVPTEVPMLEMYFVLFDAKFAHYFFDLVLTPEFTNQTSAWGPDLLWCSAAKEWDGSRPSCHLVPVVSSHEDTQQITKNVTTHKGGGESMVKMFKENPQFAKWMRAPEKWRSLIGGQKPLQIEERCRALLKMKDSDPFDLAACPRKVTELAGAAF